MHLQAATDSMSPAPIGIVGWVSPVGDKVLVQDSEVLRGQGLRKPCGVAQLRPVRRRLHPVLHQRQVPPEASPARELV